MYHYTYKLELPETKEYYFGSRTSKVKPSDDVYYMGSMKSWRPDKKKLIKTIIKEGFKTREECIKHERELILSHRDDILNMNGHIPGIGFNTNGLGQYVDENGKVFRVSKNDELVLNGVLKPFWLGKKHNEESRKKMRDSALGKKLNEETKIKMSKFWKGKPKSKETKQKMSEAAKGDNNNYKRYLERTGLPHAKSKTILQLSLNGDLIKEWVNASVASIECGLGYKAINQCARGKTKTSGGFVWKYKD